jgi:hypothetical protein
MQIDATEAANAAALLATSAASCAFFETEASSFDNFASMSEDSAEFLAERIARFIASASSGISLDVTESGNDARILLTFSSTLVNTDINRIYH